MTLAQKIEQILKEELKPENLKTVIDLAEFLKFKEIQQRWEQIDDSEPEEVTDEEKTRLEEIVADGDFIPTEQLLKELGISEDEVCN